MKTPTSIAFAFLLAACAGALCATRAFGGDPAPAAPVAAAARTFSFTYLAKVPKPPDGAKRLDAWIPTPVSDDLQSVTDLKVTAMVDDKAVAFEQAKDETYGNSMVHVGVDAPAGPLLLEWTATVTRKADSGQGAGPVLDRFKEADRLVPVTGRAATLAKELGVEGTADLMARAKKAYDNVLATMVYDKVAPGWGKGDFERACDVGKGNCTDFHAKFTGIARAGGIPVRFTMGIPLSTEAKGTAGGYHCWAHFYDGTHWIPVDISEAQKVNAKDPAKAQWFFGHLDPDRVALSVGRDLVLSPKQKGEPLAFFAYPYVEVDGKATDPLPKENRAFTWESK